MNTTTTRLSVLIGAILTVFVGVKAQTNDAPKWITIRPESEEAGSMLYQAESDFSGKHYESFIYGRDLIGVAKWEPGKELPVSMSTIVTNARNSFEKQFPQFSQFKLMSVNLLHLTVVDDWIVSVEFNGTDFTEGGPGAFEDKKINVLVLLNGHVITPSVTAK